MATLIIDHFQDYTDGDPVIPANTTEIVFSGGGGAMFNSSQFGGTGISTNVAIDGNFHDRFIVVSIDGVGTSFSAAGWTFSNWFEFSDVVILGSDGNDTLVGSSGVDQIEGAGGADYLSGGAGKDALYGGAGDDIYVMEDGADSVSDNGGGTDTIISTISRSLADYWGIERLTLTGASAINGTGTTLANIISGNAAANVLTGGLGADVLIGGLGNDTYVMENGTDTISDSAGVDTITSTISRSLAGYGTIERLTLLGTGAINGTGNGLANIITGNAAANILTGGLGNDTLIGGGGTDIYVLANGADIVVDSSGIDLATSTITRNMLAAGLATVERMTVLSGNAGVTGNNLNNTITGSTGANILSGGVGNDILIGGAGNDTLIGGVGIDRLTGGANNDFFVFNGPLNVAHRDVITDFFAPQDTFRLENAVMTKVGPVGVLKAPAFFAGAAAHDADDRIIYNKVNGAISYDSNGNLAGGVTLLGTLTIKPTLTAADFVVI